MVRLALTKFQTSAERRLYAATSSAARHSNNPTQPLAATKKLQTTNEHE